MQDNYTLKGKHLKYQERILIYKWHNEGRSNREIAKLLGRAPQTVNNELNRGKVLQQLKPSMYRYVYHPDYAQNTYKHNRENSVKHSILNRDIIRKIIYFNKMKVSPEMMVNKYGLQVSISSIYYWIHNNKLGKEIKLLYPSKHHKKHKKASIYFKPLGKSIDERPSYINLRLESNHFEIDTVVLTREKINVY